MKRVPGVALLRLREIGPVWPAALASLGCFLVNLWMLRRLIYLQGTGEQHD